MKSGYDVLLLRLLALPTSAGGARATAMLLRVGARVVVVGGVFATGCIVTGAPWYYVAAIAVAGGVTAMRMSESLAKVAGAPRVAGAIQLVATVFVISTFLLWQVSSATALLCLAAASAAASLLSVPLYLRHVRRRPSAAARAPGAGTSRRELRWVGLTGGLAVVISQSDILIVDALVGPEASGAYSLAWRAASLVSLPLLLLNFTFGGRLGQAAATSSASAFQQLLDDVSRKSLRYSSCMLPCVFVAALMALPRLGYPGGTVVVITSILMVAQFANVIGGPLVITLSLQGQARSLVGLLATAAALNLALSVGLGLWLDGVGVALGTCCAQAVLAVAGVRFVRKRLGLRLGYAALAGRRDGRP